MGDSFWCRERGVDHMGALFLEGRRLSAKIQHRSGKINFDLPYIPLALLPFTGFLRACLNF